MTWSVYIGKQVPVGNSAGEYRRISNASGPQSSQGQYTATQDIGKQVAAGTSGEYRRIVVATGIVSIPYSFIHSTTQSFVIGINHHS